MLGRKIFPGLVLLASAILLINASYALYWLKNMKDRSADGPFRHFAVNEKEVDTANAHIRVEIADKKTGLELEEFFSSSGFECKRTFKSELGPDEKESWTKRRPTSYSSVGCRYEYNFLGVWGAVVTLDKEDRLLGDVKLFNGSRLN